MRIISKFKDFYDCGMAYGMEQDLVFVRNQKQIDETGKYLAPCGPACDNNKKVKADEFVIGFCGKTYPAIRLITCEEYNQTDEVKDCKKVFAYSVEDADKFIESNFSDKEVEAYYSSKWNDFYSKRRKIWPDTHVCHGSFEKYFNKCAERIDKHEQYFIENNVPIFISYNWAGPSSWWRVPSYAGVEDDSDLRWKGSNHIIHNDCLKSVEFFRKYDPYKAFQELQMYLCGPLASAVGNDGHKAKYKGQMMEPDFDDLTKRDSKGFDKYSFKNVGSSKKRKRNKKKKI